MFYDASERLERVETNIGESLAFGYDAEDRISSMTDHAGRTWGYRYDAVGNLEYVDNPDLSSKQYHYENTNYPHALTGITDGRGIRYATYGYDNDGLSNLTTHANDVGRVSIVYNNGTRTLTNSRGENSTYDISYLLGVARVDNAA